VYDATIAHPRRPDTIPAWVAGVVPLALAILSAVGAEAFLARSLHSSPTAAAAGVVRAALDATCALFFCGLVTEATKLGVGWLRPYFLSACAPALDPNTGMVPDIGDAGPGAPPCTSSADAQRPARVSFPSGHTSMSTVSAAFAAAYLAWAVARGLRAGGLSPRARDGVATAALLAGLAQLAFAWGIGATRLNDFRHHPADVVGGLVLGGTIGGAFAVRSILGRGRELFDKEEEGGGGEEEPRRLGSGDGAV